VNLGFEIYAALTRRPDTPTQIHPIFRVTKRIFTHNLI